MKSRYLLVRRRTPAWQQIEKRRICARNADKLKLGSKLINPMSPRGKGGKCVQECFG
jgi:hypothetical protein